MIEFHVEAMSCGHCASMVTQAVKFADPDAQVEVDLAGKKVRVASAEDRATLASALTDAGYPPA